VHRVQMEVRQNPNPFIYNIL